MRSFTLLWLTTTALLAGCAAPLSRVQVEERAPVPVATATAIDGAVVPLDEGPQLLILLRALW